MVTSSSTQSNTVASTAILKAIGLSAATAAAALLAATAIHRRQKRILDADMRDTSECKLKIAVLAEVDPRIDSGRILQTVLLEVLSVLSAREALKAMPATSRSLAAMLQRRHDSELRAWVKNRVLWPPEDERVSLRSEFGPSSTASGPKKARSQDSSGRIRDIEAAETVLSKECARRHLERLFLCSMREDWDEPPAEGPKDGTGKATSSSDTFLGGPMVWAARRATSGSAAAREIHWLIQWQVPVDGVDVNGWTALIWSAFRGSADACRTLLKGGANPDHIGREGSSALSVACRCANKDVVEVLLSNGASPYLVPIGNGNFDVHVGDDILELVRASRKARAGDTTRKDRQRDLFRM